MIYLLLALFVGALLPLQAAINATLRAPLGGPVQAALASVLVSFVTLSGFVIASRTPVPQNLGAVAPWAWTGGLLGAFYLDDDYFSHPEIGRRHDFWAGDLRATAGFAGARSVRIFGRAATRFERAARVGRGVFADRRGFNSPILTRHQN